MLQTRLRATSGDARQAFTRHIADTSISGARVARELSALIELRGKPELVVSDHGTEFTSNAVLAWSSAYGVARH